MYLPAGTKCTPDLYNEKSTVSSFILALAHTPLRLGTPERVHRDSLRELSESITQCG